MQNSCQHYLDKTEKINCFPITWATQGHPPEASFLNGFSRLRGKLEPTQRWHSAELAPTRELAHTLVLKNCPLGQDRKITSFPITWATQGHPDGGTPIQANL
jgi:hypothetical protein